MDRETYDSGIKKLISDQNKFKKLKKDVTFNREGQLKKFLHKLKKEKIFDDVDYNNVYPKGSSPAHIYALPKLHKLSSHNSLSSDIPFCPIVSSIGTYNYNLAKYLCNLLSPYIPDDYCTKDSFTFVKEIQEVSLNNSFHVSFDVSSLFTNIPLDETIEIALNLIFENTPDIKITRENLKQLFLFTTAKTHFIFKGEFYDQVDGVVVWVHL